jgi:hypothetical protein
VASKASKKRRKDQRVAEYQRERGEIRTAAAERRRASGGVPAVLVEPSEVRRDCSLVTQAIQQRWPIGADKAAAVVDRLMGIIQTTEVMEPTVDGGIGPNQGKADANAVAASRVLTAMVAQNQRDEQAARPKQGMTVNVGVAVNGGTDDRRTRTLAIAERIRAGRVS